MTTKVDIVKPKIIKVHKLDDYEPLLKGVRIAACMISASHQIVDETEVLKRLNALALNGPSDGNCCSCCGVGPFETRAQQTAHYKHHWHTHNLKRKLFGKEPLTLGQFSCRQDDNSSVSGSDSETEATNNKPAQDLFSAVTRHCKAFFTNKKEQVFCIYRCILHHRKEELSTDGEGTAWAERCEKFIYPTFQRWAIFLVSGGHFAGAVFTGGTVVLHKTHHSYVTRRGQGHAQANRDRGGNTPRSAGASLRRYNQAQFLEHVQEILASWTNDLVGCYLILYRAVGQLNQAALFGKLSPINRDDPRVRVLPFPTRKPTYKEVQRVHDIVASVEVYESMEQFQKALIASTSKTAVKANNEGVIVEKPSKKPSRSTINKIINRAKSRERTPRELPTQTMSSEDEGPCFIDSETPVNWIKTLSEQSSIGLITDSRKDLLLDDPVASPESSESEADDAKDTNKAKKKKKKKPEDKPVIKKGEKLIIPVNIKKIWKSISSDEVSSLETILETWEGSSLQTACNTQDPHDGNTALHKAAIAAKPEMVTQILSVGGDPCIRNHQQQTPYAATPHADTRLAFRLFQGQFPDKYNYSKSQIPGPATPEVLEQEKERKAQQKKAKRQRDKERQIEKIKTNHFMNLNDTAKVESSEKRCFLCAQPLPNKPFEYEKYKFCSIRCLQNHRNLRPLQKSAYTLLT